MAQMVIDPEEVQRMATDIAAKAAAATDQIKSFVALAKGVTDQSWVATSGQAYGMALIEADTIASQAMSSFQQLSTAAQLAAQNFIQANAASTVQ